MAVIRVVAAAVVEVVDLIPLRHDRFRGQGNVNGEPVTASSLPPCLCSPSTANFIQHTSGGLGRLVGGEQDDERRHVVGLEGLNHLLRHDSASELGSGIGRDGVDENIVLGALTS